MHLIKPCPNCSRKIRFPIDKGKVKVSCTCGYSFIADPDNKDLYKDGKFDLSPSTKSSFIAKKWHSFTQSFSLNKLKIQFLNNLLQIKYNIQNFKLLPVSEQKRILLQFTGIIISILLFILLLHAL